MKQKLSVPVMVLLIAGMALPMLLNAQDDKKKGEEKKGYQFEIIDEIPVTSVKNQYRSGTCWSFASTSFLEAELLRMGKGEYDLSEMFIVWNTYYDKAKRYVRWHGKINFGAGGAFHDATEVYRNIGMVPEEAYSGKVIGEENHVHGEMDAALEGYMDAILKNKNRKLTPVWQQGLSGILDAYLGEYPETFIYEGKEYSPESFADMLDLNMDDYVEIGSYTHHPFYEEFVIEIPDNWMFGLIYNVPLDEMMEVIDYALGNGYTVAWGADVSEKGFSWKNGLAIVPEADLEDMTGTERERWEALSKKEKEEMLYKFEDPGAEKVITQEMRQRAFDNYETTDDHGMHITGIAKDQDGNEYYLVKNSWGTTGNDFEGYFYASKPFVAYKTIDIMVHKDAVPQNIREKLGF
jgi:bleomycin hydrolase